MKASDETVQADCAEAPKPPPHTNELLRARETAALTTARLRLSAAAALDASRPAALKTPLRLPRPCTAEPLTPAAALHPCGLSKVEPNHTQNHRGEIARSACNRSRPSSDIERVLSCEQIPHRAARTARTRSLLRLLPSANASSRHAATGCRAVRFSMASAQLSSLLEHRWADSRSPAGHS